MARSTSQFQTIRSEGALLPPDVLRAIASQKVEGTSPESYHLPPGTKLNEAIAHSWSVLQKHWKAFQEFRCRLPQQETGTEVTNQNWLLPLFEELKYGRLVTTKAPEIDGRTYPIERFYGQAPIHLVGCNLPLDRRTKGARGAATASPHSMMQEFLNRSEGSLWGFFSNGLVLRILRDNVSLSRQAYVEFDLEAMMEGEVYADFGLLWMLCHQSRVEGGKPQEFWLEKWSQLAREQGTRVLSDLRSGVAKAIEALGRGFLVHPRNDWLRQQLQDGQLDKQEYYRQVLRIVYRLLFLFVAEDRGLLHGPDVESAACDLYDTHYSTRRLRDLADQIRGSKHADLWYSLSLVFDALGRPEGCPHLGLPALGSFLWRRSSISALLGPAHKGAEAVEHPVLISNDDLLAAVRALAFVEQDKARRSVDYRNLGSEELGSVYESLLELHPAVNIPGRTFELDVAAGHERKTTGSYYTPDSLVQCLLDSALEPVVAERIQGKKVDEAAKALLDLKVCDPACGSGHFLIAAAHRLARHLARIRSGEAEPSPSDYQHALRDVISHCIYGVDINPMAVELCKVSLWMEALEPGKPLSFLDHHIQCGNSLLGATPALLKQGIPDEAFEPIEGDDKKLCKEYKKQNRDERRGQKTLFADGGKPWERLGDLAGALAAFDTSGDDSLDVVRSKEDGYATLVASAGYLSGRFWADAWCAAFVWKKTKEFDYGITEDVFRHIERNPHDCSPWMRAEIQRLAQQYQFLHWHLAFPQVFRVADAVDEAANEQLGWSGGFDCVLGNPPWERIKLQEQEWFAERRPEVANARNAAERRRMIQALAEHDPDLYRAFLDDRRKAEAESQFVRSSGRYPLCGRGDVNTYTLFSETNRCLINPMGRVGCIVPSGIATDDTTKVFFQDLVEKESLVSLFSFFEIRLFFPDTDSRNPFCLLTLTAIGRPAREGAAFVFDARTIHDLQAPTRRFTLSHEDIALLNPNTRTCPLFRSNRDAELNKAIYRRVPVLIREAQGDEPEANPWGVRFLRMLDMANDSGLFRTREQLEAEGWRLEGNVFHKGTKEYLPLYEAKMLHQFDHRFSTYEGQTEAQANQGKLPELDESQHADPYQVLLPRYWVPCGEVERSLDGKWDRQWLLGWRDICRNTDQRTVIATILPYVGVGHTAPLLLSKSSPNNVACLCANLASYAFDYVSRQKVGGTHLTFGLIQQLPLITPNQYSDSASWSDCGPIGTWVLPRTLELVYTSWDLGALATDCGFSGPPFRWDEARRFLIRCELDAAYFHLYGVAREDVDYVMETFPVVKRKDEQAHGEYRTKRVILEIYDEMARAIETGQPYRTRLDPPPADPRVAHQPQMRSLAYGDVVADILLLLREWNAAVSILALEPAVLLMQNEQARKVFLGRAQQKASSSASKGANASRAIEGMDLVYHGLVLNGAIEAVGQNGYRLLRPDLIANLSPENQRRARQVVEAIKRLDRAEDALSLVAEVTHERYTVAVP